jgi:hypothetical protein
LIDDSEKVGLERNIEKPEYTLLFGHWNAGQNRDIKQQIVRKYYNVNIWE